MNLQAGTSDTSYFLSGMDNMPLTLLNLGPYPVGRPDFSGLTLTAQPSTSTIIPKSTMYPDVLHPDFQLRCKGLHTLLVTLQHLDIRSEIRDFYTALGTFILNIRPRSFIFYLVGMNGKPLLLPTTANLRGNGIVCHQCQGRLVLGPSGRIVHWRDWRAAMMNEIPDHFRTALLPMLMNGWEGLQRVEIRGVMKCFLVDMRRELSGRGIVLVGDGWEEEPVFTEASAA